VQLDPPVPLTAVWFGLPPNTIIITFNHPLNAGALDPANWSAVHALFKHTCATAIAAGNTVTLTMVQGAPTLDPNNVTYAPPPHDVTAGPRAVPAAAFATFPLT